MKHFAGVCALAVGLASPALAQDWQKEWAETQARARGQRLVLAVHALEGHAPIVEAFQKRFPDIKVELTLQGQTVTAPRVITEQKNGIFAWDSWWGATGNMTTVVLPTGGFDKITDYMILPEVKDAQNWNAPDYLYTSDKGPYVFVHTHYEEAAVYFNKGVVKGFAPTSIDALVDPRLKGLIAIRDPTKPNNGTSALAGVLKEQGPDFVNRLFGQMDPTVIDNPRQLTDAVMRGDKALIIGGSQDIVNQCRIAGACADVSKLPYGRYVLSRGVGVMKNAPHKDSTKVWINWLLSREGQETYVKIWAQHNSTGAVSLRKDVQPDPKHLDSVPDYTKLDQYLLIATESGEATLKQVQSLYGAVKDRAR